MAAATEDPKEHIENTDREAEFYYLTPTPPSEEENETEKQEDKEEGNDERGEGEGEEGEGLKLSKSKLRKLKKKENALKYRAEKRLKERESRKRRKREKRERGEDTGPSKKELKRNKMADSACRVKVAIDCSFDHLMSEKDIMKLNQQIGYAYSSNRRAADPVQYYVTSLSGQTKERMDKIGDYANWDVYFRENSYLEEFDKESIVYLSSESDNVLTTLDPQKVYIIGGLVDHNHHKGLCHKLAVEKGINHAQLPIGQYVELKSRRVLTINHVFEILLRYTETNNWEEAFFAVLPKRKGATSKPSKHSERQGANSAAGCNNTTDTNSASSSEVPEESTVLNQKSDDATDIAEKDTKNAEKAHNGNSEKQPGQEVKEDVEEAGDDVR